jgi:hypothetical protein
MSDNPKMDDYLDGSESDPDKLVSVPDDYQPYTCDHCGKQYSKADWGVRISKVVRHHEERCAERDTDE